MLESLVQIGVLMSEARDFPRLLEEILRQAQSCCDADAGTLYVPVGDELRFELVRTESLGIALGGTTGFPVDYPPLPLHDPATGEPNLRYIATYAALTGETVNIPDAYEAEGFDFSGTRAFDRATGYRSRSFLTVPLRRDGGDLLGVVQLINARDADTGEVVAFDRDAERMVLALCRLAAISLEAHMRERGLRRQLENLRIEVDAARQAQQVAEITDSDYFVRLQARARAFRRARP
jgi:GAF domain-containing protein